MFGLDPLTLSSMVVLAASAGCPAHAPTQINVVPKTAKVHFDYTKPLKQIQTTQTDTVNPYGFHAKSITNGYTQSGIAKRTSMSFDYSFDKRTGQVCLWYKSIDVGLEVAPKVVIAKEIYQDSCMRTAVSTHEMKHVDVERDVVNEFARSIGQKVYKELKSRGFTVGPFPYQQAEAIKQSMGRVVQQVLDLEFQKMDIALMERQRAVDSLEEYESVGKRCRRFQSNKNALYDQWLQ